MKNFYISFLFLHISLFISIFLFNSECYAKRNRIIEPKTIYSLGCSDISPNGKIANILNLGSDYTDLQREDLLEEIKGNVVCWRINVYEIQRDKNNIYKIFSNPSQNSVGSIIYIDGNFLNDESKKILHSLKTGSYVDIKGILTGDTFMRSLIINPAVLLRR